MKTADHHYPKRQPADLARETRRVGPWLLLAMLFGITSAALAQLGPPLSTLPAQAREMTMHDVQTLLAERPDIGILDVRTAEEVTERGKLPGAKHLDFFREDFAKELAKLGLDPGKPCVLYCAIGGRARRAAGRLATAGFKDIVILAGGFNAWKKAGKPIEGGK